MKFKAQPWQRNDYNRRAQRRSQDGQRPHHRCYRFRQRLTGVERVDQDQWLFYGVEGWTCLDCQNFQPGSFLNPFKTDDENKIVEIKARDVTPHDGQPGHENQKAARNSNQVPSSPRQLRAMS